MADDSMDLFDVTLETHPPRTPLKTLNKDTSSILNTQSSVLSMSILDQVGIAAIEVFLKEKKIKLTISTNRRSEIAYDTTRKYSRRPNNLSKIPRTFRFLKGLHMTQSFSGCPHRSKIFCSRIEVRIRGLYRSFAHSFIENGLKNEAHYIVTTEKSVTRRNWLAVRLAKRVLIIAGTGNAPESHLLSTDKRRQDTCCRNFSF